MGWTEVANVNGRIGAVDSASVSVSDHGFLYGESVYETIRTYERRPFLLPAHLARLQRSAASIHLPLPWPLDELQSRILATLRASTHDGEFAVRVVATRGDGPFGYDPALCPRPNLVILARRLKEPAAGTLENGVSAATASIRRNPIEALDPRIKSSNLLNNILAAHEARRAGVDEALLLNTSGHLAESTMSNVFLVRDGRLMTPSIDCGLLSGVTRDLVIEMAVEDGIPCEEGHYGPAEIAAAEEIFLTSTTREILHIGRLDGRPVGAGTKGPVTSRLQALFRERVESFLRETPAPSGDAEPRPRVAIFVDVQNMYYAAKQLGARLNYGSLMAAATRQRELVRALAYVVRNKDIDQSGFLAMLQQRNYTVRIKDLKVRQDGSSKADWDMEIALDMLAMAHEIDVAVLASGDGDFAPLVSHIRGLGPTVEVFSFPDSTARELIDAADAYVALDDEFLIPT